MGILFFVLVAGMDDKKRKGREEKTEAEREKIKVEIKKTKVFIAVAIIATIVYVVKDGVIEFAEYKRKSKSEQQSEEIAQQEKEEKEYPQMELDTGSIVKCGDKKYQVVIISNINADAVIKNGTLVVEYRISVQNKDTSVNYYLDGAIYDEKVEYLEELDSGMLLLRKDYRKFTEMMEACLEGQDINVIGEMVFQPYLFIYYKYTCGKENLEGYYKINIEEHGFGAVEAVDEPEEYFYVYEIEV